MIDFLLKIFLYLIILKELLNVLNLNMIVSVLKTNIQCMLQQMLDMRDKNLERKYKP